MSGTTKYTPAPQRDSLDEAANYPQPPPTYEDQPGPSHDEDALLGGPRSDGDNVPDDFKVRGPFKSWNYVHSDNTDLDKFGGSVAEATIDIRMQFVRKVYSILWVFSGIKKVFQYW
jgi:protein lifeguard